MKMVCIHPDDVRWLGRWIRNHLICVSAIACFVVSGRFATDLPGVSMNPLVASQTLAVSADAATPGIRSVPPEGWRRTRNGWEHVSSWMTSQTPLSELVETQQDREPAWMRSVLGTLRSIPPLAFAAIQLGLIAVIVRLTRDTTAVG